MEQRPQRALSVGRLSSKLAPQRQKAIHSPLFGPVTRRLLRSVHRRARRAPHPSLSPLTRGEGEQSQRFVLYHLVERRSRDLIEFIPLSEGIRQPRSSPALRARA